MGKEWLRWVVIDRSNKRSSGRRRRRWGEMENEVASTGCICAIFQMFDLHPVNQHQRSDFDFDFDFQKGVNSFKGIEAPRNSLELGNYSTAIKEGTDLDFTNVGIEEIRTNVSLSPRVSTSRSKSGSNDLSSSCNSPGTKTPTLVARLMGLDLLPDCNSPSNSNLKPHLHRNRHTKDGNFLHGRSGRNFYDSDISSGTRSLPETPRISSARRSDVERHRLSLQMNKENLNEELDRATTRSRSDKQVKDRPGRRVGVDITNSNRAIEKTRRDENLITHKPRSKNLKKLPREIGPDSRESVGQSCSSSSGFFDKPITNSNNHPLRQRNQIIPPQESQQQQQKGAKKVKSPGKCSLSGIKKLPRQASGNAIRNKKQEQFVHSTGTHNANLTGKKSKKTPLSSDILTKLHRKQTITDAFSSIRSIQLSRNPSHPYNPQGNGGAAAKYGNYIQTILERAGIVENAPPFALAKLHAFSRAIDPSILYYLEFFFHSGTGTNLSHRCSRKLIFELVDELLAEIWKPRFDFTSRVFAAAPDAQFPLVEELCKKIDGLSATNCATIEEIDYLVDEDLRKLVVEEEIESIVCKIEGGIVEGLVRETAAMMVRRRSGGIGRYHARASG